MVSTIITRTELSPVVPIPISLFRASKLSVTTAIDNPMERTTLSMICSRLKKTSVQAKPGRKKTSIKPRTALKPGRRSRNGKRKSINSLIGSSRILLIIPEWISLLLCYYRSVYPNQFRCQVQARRQTSALYRSLF